MLPAIPLRLTLAVLAATIAATLPPAIVRAEADMAPPTLKPNALWYVGPPRLAAGNRRSVKLRPQDPLVLIQISAGTCINANVATQCKFKYAWVRMYNKSYALV